MPSPITDSKISFNQLIIKLLNLTRNKIIKIIVYYAFKYESVIIKT